MKPNVLLLAALLTLTGVAPLKAQVPPPYSSNAFAYFHLSVPAGYSMIANPFDTTNNTIESLLTDVPNFCNILKWTGTEFEIATFLFGAWDNPMVTLHPGEGAFINTESPFTILWMGNVPQGQMTNDIPPGYSIRSGKIPMGRGSDIIILPTALQAFDNLLKWNGSGYSVYTVLPGGMWDPAEPQIKVGESFFLYVTDYRTWRFTFSVN